MSIRTIFSFFTFERCLVVLLWAPYGYAQPEGGPQAADAFLAPDSEKPINTLIIAATQQGGPGALGYLRGREPVALSLEQALDAAVQRNLSIQVQQQNQIIAQHFVIESQAAFDPILNLFGSYKRTETFERSEEILRDRATVQNFLNTSTRNQAPNPADENNLTRDPGTTFGNFTCVSVDGDVVNASQCSLKPSPSLAREFASVDSRPVTAWDFSWGLERWDFPWGPHLEVTFQSRRRIKNFYQLDPLGFDQPLSLDDPIGQGSRFPWTTSFVAAFDTPLPFSKNFGPYGFFENVNVMLASVSSRQADWALQAVANSVLSAVDGAYWELVRSIKQLQITMDQRRVLEDLAKRGEVLFQAQRMTTYDKAQIDADLENIKNSEEIVWNNFIANSNGLLDLLDYAPATIILPVGYSSELHTPVIVDPKSAFDTAARRRPEIKLSQLAIESSEIVLRQAKTQTRPDLSFTAGVALNQSDAVLGFDSWEDSMANVFDPDATNFFVGVSFRIPLGNRGLRSALSQARVSRSQAWDLGQQTINSVTQEINTLVATTFSTQGQIAQRKGSLDLAHLAYSKASNLREQTLVTDFELLRKLGDLLSAKSAYINALVDHKQTKARLLAAEGVLAEGYRGSGP